MAELNSTSKCKKKKTYEGEDRISSLPNNIIQDILSFLPTKDAVSTSVLSTRWKYTWTGISSLDFCNNLVWNDNGKTKFTNFVAKVLLLHDATVINKFRLYSERTLDTFWVNAWMYTVLRRKVRELVIELQNIDHPIVLPCSCLNCELLMLTGLDYISVSIRHPMDCSHFDFELLKIKNVDSIPNHLTSNSLSRLKVLHLTNIDISFDQASEQVSFNCPILEDALFESCEWVNIKAVNFFAPALKRLIVVNDGFRGNGDCKLKVYAQSLVFLDVSILLSYELSLYNLSSLQKASIDIRYYEVSDEFQKYCLSVILEAITNVRDLTLSDLTMDYMYDASLTKDLLALSNFKTLRVCSQNNLLDGHTLTKFFRYMPIIEALFFSEGLGDAAAAGHDSDTYGWTIKTTHRPLLSNLKLVEISNSNGHLNEREMVEFLLENARALKKITITASSTLRSDPQKQLEYAKELLLLPRDSTCVIDFS